MPKTVQLSEEAYAGLAALKREGESFSDVVNRLLRERKNPRALLGLEGPRDEFDLEALRRFSRERDLEKLAGRGVQRAEGEAPKGGRNRGG